MRATGELGWKSGFCQRDQENIANRQKKIRIQFPKRTFRISMEKKTSKQPWKRTASVIQWRVLRTRKTWTLLSPLRSEIFHILPFFCWLYKVIWLRMVHISLFSASLKVCAFLLIIWAFVLERYKCCEKSIYIYFLVEFYLLKYYDYICIVFECCYHYPGYSFLMACCLYI